MGVAALLALAGCDAGPTAGTPIAGTTTATSTASVEVTAAVCKRFADNKALKDFRAQRASGQAIDVNLATRATDALSGFSADAVKKDLDSGVSVALNDAATKALVVGTGIAQGAFDAPAFEKLVGEVDDACRGH